MSIPEEQVQFMRINALARQFGWEMIEQRVLPGELIITLRKKLPTSPELTEAQEEPVTEGPT